MCGTWHVPLGTFAQGSGYIDDTFHHTFLPWIYFLRDRNFHTDLKICL